MDQGGIHSAANLWRQNAIHVKRLPPMLNVSNIQQTFEWFEMLGWKKGVGL